MWISFYADRLAEAKAKARAKLGHDPQTYYLFGNNPMDNTDKARSYEFTGVSVAKNLLTDSLYKKAKGYNMGVGTWTYIDSAEDDSRLHTALLSGTYQLDFATIDYKIFN